MFATLEAIRERMHNDGQSFDNALREVAQHTVFTTHTPVPAGHDRFDGGLIEGVHAHDRRTQRLVDVVDRLRDPAA